MTPSAQVTTLPTRCETSARTIWGAEHVRREYAQAGEALAGQLDKLLSVIRLPSVDFRVIGFGQRMTAYPIGGFRVYDDDLIVVENIAGEREFTRKAEPDAVAAFLEAFSELRQAASTGAEAEAVIQQALADLRR